MGYATAYEFDNLTLFLSLEDIIFDALALRCYSSLTPVRHLRLHSMDPHKAGYIKSVLVRHT